MSISKIVYKLILSRLSLIFIQREKHTYKIVI